MENKHGKINSCRCVVGSEEGRDWPGGEKGEKGARGWKGRGGNGTGGLLQLRGMDRTRLGEVEAKTDSFVGCGMGERGTAK